MSSSGLRALRRGKTIAAATAPPVRLPPEPPAPRHRFSTEKGYGFITQDDGDKDVFVHHSAIRGEGYKSLAEGARVEYEVEQGPKGPQARDVRALASL
jgi:cold shock protein